ncbi:MAG: hypothetical protein AAB316_22565 [Bacteroidota bacterium]
MVNVTSIAEHDVLDKVDIYFVEEALADMKENIAIIYVCANDDWRKDDAWKKKGKKYYRIVMPYDKVKNMDAEAVRQWMLRLAEERLGLVGQA